MAIDHDYDLIVIGAGIAGLVSAVTANSLGKRTAIVEKRQVGGNCTNFTCIPSKALIRLAHVSREMAHLDRIGFRAAPGVGLETRNVMGHVRSVVQKAYEKDLPETFEQIGIRMLSGTAAFVDPHRIRVNGKTLAAEKFIIAAGTRPLVPPIPGLRESEYLTNETVFQLDDLPPSLIILGGGVDGLEYASAFGRLGVDTTVVEMGSSLLPTADRELVNVLRKALEADGIRLLTGTKAVSVSQRTEGVSLSIEGEEGQTGEISADRVLVTIGRKPDLEDLCLDAASVEHTPRGITTDETLRTTAANIYACGDIVGPYQLATTAEYQGVLAATNAVLPIKQKVDYRNNVFVIFTDPPLAYIGLTEEQSHARYGDRINVYRFDYANMRRALIDGTDVGVAKILCNRRGRIIGAHILGEAAGEVIHEVQVIKALNKPLHRLHSVTHAYPTYAQALVGRASQLAYLDRMGGSFFVKAGLALLPGYANRLRLARDRLAEIEPPSSHREPARLNVVIEAEAATGRALQMRAMCLDARACVIDLPEDLSEPDEEPILASYAGSGATYPQSMILNFSHVRRMNGLGASMFVKLTARARAKRVRVSAFGLPDGIRDAFNVTGLDQVIHISESPAQALAAAGVVTEFEGRSEPSIATDADHWAKPVASLEVPPMPEEARNLNVNSRRAISPVHGFGQLWEKIFRLHVADPVITPEQTVAALKENFPRFQPSFNRFFASPAGIQPGEIVLIDSSTPGGPVSTGVMVVYADERSFTFITPQGHPEAGLVSFSAYRLHGTTVVQILGLARAGDPVYEGAFRLIGSKVQGKIWTHVLRSLAIHLGVPSHISVEQRCVDRRLQWSQVMNLRYNAQIITLAHEPVRLLRRLMRGRGDKRSDSR
jgi:pyruvate/2-oxoglutarate dehydrogenase complex dihydrolipoamide dehydrogenase (E3) component/anti-anti-sigma regulatory factor